jgi:hypothetical protein
MSESLVGGILDIVRGIVTIASFGVVSRAVGLGFDEIFRVGCSRCNGMGKIICPTCNGTNTLSKRPAQSIPHIGILNRRYEDIYECFVCGPTTAYENLGLLGEDEDMYEADRIKETIRNAVTKKTIEPRAPLAGTIFCPSCHGQGSLWHFVPNISSLSGSHEPWCLKYSHERQPSYAKDDRAHSHGNYVEWPSRPLRPISEREVGYFGDDIFDYDDSIAENTWSLMEKEYDRVGSGKKTELKQPEDLEDFQFVTIQDVSKFKEFNHGG